MKILHISWLDSCSSHGWLEPDNVNPEPAPCESVGFFVRESKTCVTLALSRGVGNTTPFADYITIPRGCITKIKVLAR